MRTALPHRGALAASFALFLGLCAASWLKPDLTTNDFERLGDLRLTFAFFALFVGLGAAYVAQLSPAQPPRAGVVLLTLSALALPALLSFPVGSKDVFAYAFYGKMWGEYGVDPYFVAPSALARDPWFRFIDAWWNEHTVTYGPLFVLQTRLVYLVAADDLAATVAAYKGINVVLLAFSLWLVGRLAAASAPPGHGAAARAAALWAWSPLVLFESFGGAHNDLAMTALVLATSLAWIRDRWVLGGAMLALSFWYKWYSLALLPIALVWTLRRWEAKDAWRRIGIGAASFGLVSLLVLAPFFGSLQALLGRAVQHEVVHLIFPDEMPPPLWLVFQGLVFTGVFPGPAGRLVLDLARVGLFGLGVGWILWRRRGSAYAARAVTADLFWTFLFFFGFVVTVLYPWHILPVCALGLAVAGRRFEWAVALITVTVLLSYFLTLRYALLLCVLVAGALWLLRGGRWDRVGGSTLVR